MRGTVCGLVVMLALVISVPLAGRAELPPAPVYELTDLGTRGGAESEANDINDGGPESVGVRLRLVNARDANGATVG